MEFGAIGTHWKIVLHDKISDSAESDILKCIIERIAEYEKNYSRFLPDSLLGEMAKRAGEYALPDDAKLLFDVYEKVYRLTNGLVTPLIGGVLSDAGYDADYSLEPKVLHQPHTWESVMSYQFPKLTLHAPVLIDLGAAGKGYLVDIIAELLRNKGVKSFTINAGGDIVNEGKLIRVALEHPNDPTSAIGVATIGNESICGSAGNRRAWKQFHHIIDPKKLESPQHILAVWVVAESGRIADILTTCLFFVEPEVMQSEFTFEYLIVYADFTLKKSTGFKSELFF
jgi:thiamine biosynthesis lipoprotein